MAESAEQNKAIKKVLVVFAMEGEAMPLVKQLGIAEEGKRFSEPSPCKSFEGQLNGLEVVIVCNGKCEKHGVDHIGTVAASLCTYLACQVYKPDLIISAGTAGGFQEKGGAIADVYVSSGLAFHDRRIPMPGFDKYGKGFVEAVPTEKLVAALGLKQGVVSSSNSLDYTQECMGLMKENGASVKEMEAAAIVWVAEMFGTPMFAVKSITDIVDGSRATNEEFVENFGKATEKLQSEMVKVLDFVNGKTLGEL